MKIKLINSLKKILTEFNNDPHLIYNNKTDELWLYFRRHGSQGSKIFLKKSSNGVAWSKKQEILSSRSNRNLLSPTIIMQEKRFLMWVVNASMYPWGIDLRFSSDGKKWSPPIKCSIYNMLDDRNIWHLNINYNFEFEEYWGLLVLPKKRTPQTKDCLRFAKSKNGRDWRIMPFPKLYPSDSGWDEDKLYRAASKISEEERIWKIWYSAKNYKSEWHIGMTYATYKVDENGDCIWLNDFSNAKEYLSTPTYDESGQVVHPDLVYFPEGWGRDKKGNDWNYWLALTPFPNCKESYENPSVLVSNDGVIWRAPHGLKNPVEAEPGILIVKLLRNMKTWEFPF